MLCTMERGQECLRQALTELLDFDGRKAGNNGRGGGGQSPAFGTVWCSRVKEKKE